MKTYYLHILKSYTILLHIIKEYLKHIHLHMLNIHFQNHFGMINNFHLNIFNTSSIYLDSNFGSTKGINLSSSIYSNGPSYMFHILTLNDLMSPLKHILPHKKLQISFVESEVLHIQNSQYSNEQGLQVSYDELKI